MSAPLGDWQQRYGGIRWRVTPQGVEVEGEGVQRTKGEPVTLRRVALQWRAQIQAAAMVSGVPVELILMTAATEGALKALPDRIEYPPLRREPGYISDEETPHKISFGPMHVLLSTYRSVMKSPRGTRETASRLGHNLLAGALFILDGFGATGWDPILVAARYNAGSLVRADDPHSRFHNRWHLRAWGDHLDRAARWFGDACVVTAETELTPSLWPEPRVLVNTPTP